MAFLAMMCLIVNIFPLYVFAQSTLIWPVPGHTNKSQGFHNGNAIDISDGSIYGAEVVAAMGGTVTNIWLSDCHHNNQTEADACCRGFGTGLVITGDDGRIYQYAHMLPGSVPSSVYYGAYVSAGQKIGQVGNSGFSTGAHLHFGISIGNYWEASGINPENENYIYDTTPVPVSLSWSNSDCRWDTTNAYMYIEADTNVSGSFTEAGITVWNEAGQVVATKSENPGISGRHLNVWYNITDETGVALQPGTNYTYQFYTVFNGTRYESSVMNFRTNGQSANEWTQELSITDWRYGETANAPSASAKYGDVVYTYSTEENGTYTSEVPQAAGTYYVKATVAATEQYTGLEAVKEFHIEKAIPEFTVPTGLTMVYGDTLESVELPEGFHWYDSTELSGPVGEKEMYVYFVPADTDNYYEYEQIRVTITVQAKDLSGLKLDGIDKNTDLDKYEIKDGDTVLVKDTDYTISAVTEGDNVTVTVEFIGNYTGTTQAKYSLKEDTINTDDKENTDKNTVDDSKTDNDKSDKDAQSKDDKNADSKSEAKAPQTGDDYSVLLWAVIAVISGGTAVVLCKRTRFSNK